MPLPVKVPMDIASLCLSVIQSVSPKNIEAG